jgi:CheY-like chemotaxis protein
MLKPLEILLVEDNEGDVEMVKEALEEETSLDSLSVANNGKEALDCLYKQGKFHDAATPQLVLLDLNMPQMDGKMLLRMIKQDELFMGIPVVVLTSSRAPLDIREAYALHANCYVIKPFECMKFKEAIRLVVNFWRSVVVLP